MGIDVRDVHRAIRVPTLVLHCARRQKIEQHHELVLRQLHRFRGVEVDTAGDGFFASFDGPARAIRCASAITLGVRDLGLAVRAGLHPSSGNEGLRFLITSRT